MIYKNNSVQKLVIENYKFLIWNVFTTKLLIIKTRVFSEYLSLIPNWIMLNSIMNKKSRNPHVSPIPLILDKNSYIWKQLLLLETTQVIA